MQSAPAVIPTKPASEPFRIMDKSGFFEINVEDTASVLMECKYEGKILPVTIQTDFLQSPPVRNYTIVGDEGRIFLDLINNNTYLTKRKTGKKEFHAYKGFNRNQLFMEELKHFLQAISGKTLPSVNIKTGLSSLRMALAARESIETERPIRL